MTKGSPLEPIPGYAQFNDAQVTFLGALNREIPAIAFEELRKLTHWNPEDDPLNVEAWAKKWGVKAPFVERAAREIVDDERRHPSGRLPQFPVSRSHGLPQSWRHELAVLNKLPVEFVRLDDGIASGTMQVPGSSPGTWSTVSAPFEHLLQQEHVLAPIATDPARESRANFLERADHHWEARAMQGQRDGLTPVTPQPELLQHVRWLLHYQVKQIPYATIARDAGRTVDAVRKAVTRLAKQLDLELRVKPRGRPRQRSGE